MKLAILAFLHCEEFMKNSDDVKHRNKALMSHAEISGRNSICSGKGTDVLSYPIEKFSPIYELGTGMNFIVIKRDLRKAEKRFFLDFKHETCYILSD